MPRVVESYRRNMRFVEAFSPNEMRKRHGEFYAYHPDGQLAMSGYYLQGMPNGTWRRWYGNGQLASVHNYSAGVLHGPYVQYFDNGKKAREGQYVRGTPDGTHRIYYKHGQAKPSMFTIVDSRLTDLRISLGALDLRYDGRLRDSTLRYEKVCYLRANGTLVCKTPDQIIADLSSFVNPEDVAALMGALDTLFDNADLQLGAGEDILVACGGTVESVASTDGPPVDLSEFALDGSTLNRAPMTQPEVDKIREKCAQAAWGRLGLDSGAADFDNQRESFVLDTIAQIDDAMGSCRESSNESIANVLVVAAALITAGAAVLAALISGGGQVAGQVAGAATKEMLDDGYRPADNPDANPTVHPHDSDPTKYKLEFDDGTKAFYSNSNPELGEPGDRKKEVVHPDGSISITYYENGEAIATEEQDTEGRRTPITYIDEPRPAEEPSHNGSATGDAPPSNGGNEPDPSMPQDESGMSRCQQVAAAWEWTKDHCEQAQWQTYECAQLLRTFNGCVDLALINPGPDGDATCPHYADEAAAELARRQCEQEGWFMLDSGFDSLTCRDVDFDAVPPKKELCSDPRIMCLPDRIMFDDGGRPEMLGSSAPRQTRSGTSTALSERRSANETLVRGASASAMSWIRAEDEGFAAIDDETFDDFLMEVSTPALVVFGARNCPPCKRVQRNLSAVMDQFPESIDMRYVEVPQNPMLAERFRVQYTPTIVMFERDNVIGQRRVGAATPEILLKWVQRCLRVRDHGQESRAQR